ncbi:MAG: hypothetical protein PHN44_09220, partial [Candidatus Marinimicrobia bacterium]|nr:hypothetical protein [Candidatus Neomarinimicrobiota bacterium]
DKWRVYKVDDEGNKIGEALGEHDNEEDARAQVEALYANEKPEKEIVDVPEKELDKEQDTKSGRVIAKRNAERLSQIRKLLQEIEEDGGLGESEPEIEIPKSNTPPTEAGDKQAGSSPTPTSEDLLKLIEIEQLEISYMR